jgi:PAS domain S-box-containing protein
MKDKLLVLDDELLILTSLEQLFEEEYEVFATNNAETALTLAQQHNMAVVLCDERMPGVTGHEFLRRLIEVSTATRVMMSGYADMAALTLAVNSGKIFAYIDKPWEPLKLKAMVSAAVVHFKLVQEVALERGLLRTLMESIPDPIYFKDAQSKFIRVNQAHARALGVDDPAECIGKCDSDYFESEYARRCRIQEETIVRTGQPRIDEIEQLRIRSGVVRWMSTTKVPMFHLNGEVSGIAGISKDITAIKNSEEMLREQSEHNRMIIETAQDAFIGMAPDGSITAWNPQAELTFGWPASEMLGRRWSDTVIAPSGRAAHAQGVEHFLATVRAAKSNGTVELLALHRDGHEFPVEATIWSTRERGSAKFNAFLRDISDRRTAEEALRKETSLVQLLQAVTVAANRSSTIEHTAQTCLDEICSYSGWSVGHAFLRATNLPQELVSAGLWHIDAGPGFAAFRTATESPLASRTGMTGSIVASGKPQWIVDLTDEQPRSERTVAALKAGLRSGFGFPILVEEKTVGVLEFFSLQTVPPDEEFLTMMGNIGSQLGQVIIRQRAKEDLQRAKAAAESANLAKSEFLTTMSHEMRTPMNAILGMADLLWESPLGDEQRHHVRIFQRAGANLLALINDILDLSKVESGHVDLESIGFDLVPLLERIVQMMAARAKDRGLQLILETSPAVPSRLVGDPNRLQQILINLIGNALKFTEHGSVTLRVEPDPAGEEGWLRFNVVDTGIGIPAEKTEMIFGRFTQADSSTTRRYGGTGLGLAISRGLAELMGGQMGCTSELGKGSTFFLRAPFETRPATAPQESADPAVIANPRLEISRRQPVYRILIAEDSEDNIVLISAYLKDQGFELDFAENGKIAVDKMVSGKPDLILMDLQMPVMDGLAATRAIRVLEAGIHANPVPIIALTAHAGTENSLEAGCTEHLTKPIRKATLLEAMSRYITIESPGSSTISKPPSAAELSGGCPAWN